MTFKKPVVRYLVVAWMLMIGLHMYVDGQVAPEAVLVDKYDHAAGCDEFIGRLDGYIGEMRLYPDWKAFIVIRIPPERRPSAVMLQEMMEAWFDSRGFDRSRLEIVRADGNNFDREFWRIAPGATGPKIENSGFGYRMSDNVTKPFMLTTDEPEQICPEIDHERIYAEFLKTNPSARGNIVVPGDSAAKARRRASSILRRFQVKYGISRNRLRTFTARLAATNHDWPIVEYWYLP